MASTAPRPAPRTGGLILCGGRSRRMGTDKARLRFGSGSLLDLAVAHLAEVSQALALSVPSDGDPPSLAAPSPVPLQWVRDDAPYRGPLFGMLHGFRALAGHVERIVVMPVDMPFLTAPWLRKLLDAQVGRRAAAFRWQGFTNALTAAYAADLLPRLEQLVAEGKQRPLALLDGLEAPVLEVETLWRPEDGPSPMLDTDTPEDYRDALVAAGFGEPGGVAVTVQVAGATGGEVPPPVPIRARIAGDVARALAALFVHQPAAGTGAVFRLDTAGKRVTLRPDDLLAEGEAVYWLPPPVAS